MLPDPMLDFVEEAVPEHGRRKPCTNYDQAEPVHDIRVGSVEVGVLFSGSFFNTVIYPADVDSSEVLHLLPTRSKANENRTEQAA